MSVIETVLSRLAATYEAGRLVPFIGSGMSVPLCTDWRTFVHRLESQAAGKRLPAYDKETTRDELIRRANGAVRLLRSRRPGEFPGDVEHALLSRPGGDDPAIPPQTEALAALRWPLVVSTNYDNAYPTAVAVDLHRRQQLAVVGRSPEDCQRVLNALSVAGRSLLWAIQGYLDKPFDLPLAGEDEAARNRRVAALRSQLVVGHEEYRRVTYGDLHFRRAFAEVFRQRSLLFLGAGIQETYLQELFGEVLEYYGPSTRPHYAFIRKSPDVDPEFMLARFQIIVVQYDTHEEVIDWLKALAQRVDRPKRAPVSWSWGRIVSLPDGHWTSAPDLEVVRGPLPASRIDGECLAVSAGGSGASFFLSSGIQDMIAGWKASASETPVQRSEYLAEYHGRDVFAVRARTGDDERSLTDIFRASADLFERVADRYRGIRMQLLAAGGTEKLGAGSDSTFRTYPERFSFVQTVRAWAAWRESHPDTDCRLTLHVVLDAVYQDVASGRLDVLELLSSRDLRFFVELVTDEGRLERRLCQMMPDTTIDDLVHQLQIAPDYWAMTVTPPPSFDLQTSEPVATKLTETLQSLGVVPGSTIHFHRKRPDLH